MFPKEALMIPAGLTYTEFPAMGTTITLLLPDEKADEGVARVQQLFEVWEETLSRFRSQSELSRLNRASSTQAFVSGRLFAVLAAALRAAQATNGLYDPTLFTQITAIGYDRSFIELPAEIPGTAYQGEPGGGWRDIRLDELVHGVWLPKDVRLDFGGIAKGMAVDAAIEALQAVDITPALVNAGGDLRVLGLPPEDETWLLGVPGKGEEWSIPLKRGAVATSGIARRSWRQGDRQRHHLLDPRSGLPVENELWSVTVIAGQCMQAEVAAKVAFILGAAQGKEFLQEQRIAGFFVHTNGHAESNAYWPQELMRRYI